MTISSFHVQCETQRCAHWNRSNMVDTIVWHCASEWVLLTNRQDIVSLHAVYGACRFCCSTLLSGSHSQLCNKILTHSHNLHISKNNSPHFSNNNTKPATFIETFRLDESRRWKMHAQSCTDIVYLFHWTTHHHEQSHPSKQDSSPPTCKYDKQLYIVIQNLFYGYDIITKDQLCILHPHNIRGKTINILENQLIAVNMCINLPLADFELFLNRFQYLDFGK